MLLALALALSAPAPFSSGSIRNEGKVPHIFHAFSFARVPVEVKGSFLSKRITFPVLSHNSSKLEAKHLNT